MSKFVRTDHQHRLYGEQVSVGEPLHIQGDLELRRDIETSLEVLAKQRLMEAEEQAKGILVNARKEAAQVLDKTNAQAREMLAQMQAQVDTIRDTAHEDGFKAGFQEGYADATEQVQQETVDLLKGANTLLEGAYQAEKLVLKQFEQQTVAIMQYILKKVLRQELTEVPEMLLTLTAQAIESLYMSGKVQVVVNPAILQDLRDFASGSSDAVAQMNRFEFIADANLDAFQIFIIGQEGCFDLSPLAQVNQLLPAIESNLALPRSLETTQTAADSLASSPSQPEPLQAELPASTEPSTEALPVESPSLLQQPQPAIAESLVEPVATSPSTDAAPTDIIPAAESAQAAPYEFPSFDFDAAPERKTP